MIGVIADDLTGAAELGAVGLRHGLRAEILVRNGSGRSESRPAMRGTLRSGLPPEGGTPSPDLVCVDTDSRSCGAAEAGRRAAAAAKHLDSSGAKWIYKKVDSVLRGNVTPEIEAILKQLRLSRALLLPANPALDRVIRNGHYFIRGRPIHETEFARDPEYPRRSSSVIELLGQPNVFPVRVLHFRDPLPANGIVVGDAASVDDLACWAGRWKPGMLCAGGSGFFDALLTANGLAVRARSRRGNEADYPFSRRSPPPHVGGYARKIFARDFADSAERPELFVCGTTSRSAREFLSAARRNRTPVFSLPQALARGVGFKRRSVEAIVDRVVAALPSHRRVILTVGLPPVRASATARRLAGHLVRVAAAVLHRAVFGQAYAEGGATAIALVRRMGWGRLTVLREAAVGVATLQVGGNGSLLLTIKPGSYEWPTAIRNRATR